MTPPHLTTNFSVSTFANVFLQKSYASLDDVYEDLDAISKCVLFHIFSVHQSDWKYKNEDEDEKEKKNIHNYSQRPDAFSVEPSSWSNAKSFFRTHRILHILMKCLSRVIFE